MFRHTSGVYKLSCLAHTLIIGINSFLGSMIRVLTDKLNSTYLVYKIKVLINISYDISYDFSNYLELRSKKVNVMTEQLCCHLNTFLL